jgi:acetoin utilization deacetylase AcuC-like enzyme
LIRAFYHPDQALHDPLQFMRAGRIAAPADVPARTARLLGALGQLGVVPEAPSQQYDEARLAVHTSGFLRYLETAWDRWQQLSPRGPEVWPNTFPYWSGRPEERARPECPSDHIIAATGWYLGDLSVSLGPRSWVSIRESSNTAVAAADAVTGTSVVYALCRPSGHHARSDRASGFCFLNNTAIAAERLCRRHARVAILDVDAHHGDGTQQVFYARADVLTVSIHADPSRYYPFFTGYDHERGVGAGIGCNLNLPLPHGATGKVVLAAVDRAIEAIRRFGPEVLVVALGFDAHAQDPIGVLALEAADFAAIAGRIRQLRVPLLVVQEGGYAVDVIGDCLCAFLGELG